MCNSGYFLSYVDGLDTSYARSFLASTNARFYKELGAVHMSRASPANRADSILSRPMVAQILRT